MKVNLCIMLTFVSMSPFADRNRNDNNTSNPLLHHCHQTTPQLNLSKQGFQRAQEKNCVPMSSQVFLSCGCIK